MVPRPKLKPVHTSEEQTDGCTTTDAIISK